LERFLPGKVCVRYPKSLYTYTSKAQTAIDLRVPQKKAFWSEAVSDPGRELVSFYSDTGPDSRGRFLREIQNWSDAELELAHDYIQWLFPLAERSGFNPNAPILNAYTINRFRSDADLRRRLQTSLVRMLAFYGLEMRATVPMKVACAESFPERAENWLFLEALYEIESARLHPPDLNRDFRLLAIGC
jgi:Opioid growth factor receptor (OGFr) conserved region